jgi:2'-5' RNA ligase
MEKDSVDKVNIFVAFMLPKDSAKEMASVAEEAREVFQSQGKDENFFHCTLLFIGWIDRSELPSIQEKLQEIASQQQLFTITIDRVGYFYDSRRGCVKVLYAVPSNIPQELSNLCTLLYKDIGKPLEGKTTPHINESKIHFTITKRLKRHLSLQEFQQLKDTIKPFSISATIDNFGLYHCKDKDHRYYREIGRYGFK